MAQRVLGMGDVLSFVEKAQEVVRQEDVVELHKKILSAKFNFNDFLKQSQNVAKMGSMSRVIGMIPGMNKVTPAQIREAEKKLAFVESMINAMTAEEREKPELLAESRERRIRVVEESGKTEQEVSQLVAQLFQMRAHMQKLMGMMQGQEAIPGIGNLMESLSAYEKAPPGTARWKRRHGKTMQRELDAVVGVRTVLHIFILLGGKCIYFYTTLSLKVVRTSNLVIEVLPDHWLHWDFLSLYMHCMIAYCRMSDEELRNMINLTLTCQIDQRENCSDKMEQFLKRCFYQSGQYNSEEDFFELDRKLKEKE
ncbi:hypothetical protein GUJ93_ZPchr0008g11940 [Zizania palustris]|nr:hypothetical protein GUJ93_ZPchr0008g11940 [Zizania palustris]